MTETRHGLCGICPAGCFVTATLEDGRLVKVEPQEGNRLGMICQIGRHSPEIVHDPDRLLYPLRRIGPRGSHDFERISWDQAFESIVERLQETKRDFGPEATAIYTGRGSFDMALCDIFSCTPNDLIEPVAEPARRRAAGGTQSAVSSLKGRRPRRAEITKE